MDETIFSNEEIEEQLELVTPEDEYEEIDSDEVDRVVSALEDIVGTIDSENIQLILEEASNQIYMLVYSEDEEEDTPYEEAA